VYTPQTQPLSSSSSDQKITEQTTNKEPKRESKGNKQINDKGRTRRKRKQRERESEEKKHATIKRRTARND